MRGTESLGVGQLGWWFLRGERLHEFPRHKVVREIDAQARIAETGQAQLKRTTSGVPADRFQVSGLRVCARQQAEHEQQELRLVPGFAGSAIKGNWG
jgi:hypothetical protein